MNGNYLVIIKTAPEYEYTFALIWCSINGSGKDPNLTKKCCYKKCCSMFEKQCIKNSFHVENIVKLVKDMIVKIPCRIRFWRQEKRYPGCKCKHEGWCKIYVDVFLIQTEQFDFQNKHRKKFTFKTPGWLCSFQILKVKVIFFYLLFVQQKIWLIFFNCLVITTKQEL